MASNRLDQDVALTGPSGAILDAIRAIEDNTQGIEEATFLTDSARIDEVERNLERISEATRHKPDAVKASHPHIPWREIAGVGNVLRHDYPGVDPREIWRSVEHDLNPLRETIVAILQDIPEVD